MPLALGGLLSAVLLVFGLYCLFDVVTADAASVRNLPKLLWVVGVVLLFPLGGVLWFLLGRPTAAALMPSRPTRSRWDGETPPPPPQPSRPRRPLGPEDAPDFEVRIRRVQERELRRRRGEDPPSS